jgi:tetraacyldisaccharide 4'-kinase
MKVQQHLLEIIEGKKSAPLTRPLLRLLSYGYLGGVKMRNAAYDRGMLKAYACGLPVISIGNIVAGGTGKTPLTAYIAEELSRKKKVAILSRGYRGTLGNQTLLVTPQTPTSLCGDEPRLLADKLPDVLVFVGKDRLESAKKAQALGAEILLLDDGMQHRQLKRDVDIVSMHKDNLFGHGAFLPRGLLRDDPHRLKKASLIALQGAPTEEEYRAAKTQLRPLTDAPITAFKLEIEEGERFAGKKVAAFCALACPHRFFETLSRIGAHVVLTETLPDHAHFTRRHLEKISQTAIKLGAELLVCTEKDSVKLAESLKKSLAIETLKMRLQPTFGEAALRRVL